jgi:glutamine amidotransferase
MEALRESGLDGAAVAAIEAGVPFMGICIGMQMLYEGSEENPEVRGLGVLPGQVRELPEGVKRPQMQWNVLQPVQGDSPMLAGLDRETWVYFVHSYAPDASDDVVATCDYGGSVVAAVARRNVWATQFHPEKSGAAGLRILRNFVDRCAA